MEKVSSYRKWRKEGDEGSKRRNKAWNRGEEGEKS